MKFNYTKLEVKGLLNDAMKYGDQEKVAERLDKTPGYLSQQLNVNDEREPDFYKAAKFICAEIDVDQCRGAAVLQLMNLLCERHLIADEIKKCPKKEASVFMREFTEAIQAQIEDKPKAVQLKEIDDVIQQAKVLKGALLRDDKDEIGAGFGFSANGSGAGKVWKN